MDDAALKLRREFVKLVKPRGKRAKKRFRKPGFWLEVWTLFAEDEWFTDVLEDCAGIMLRNRSLPEDWVEEVTQKAMFIMGQKLQKKVDLDFDEHEPEETFAAWIWGKVHYYCLEALRVPKGQQKLNGLTLRLDATEPPSIHLELHVDQRLDLPLGLERLSERRRCVLELMAEGCTDEEIAELMQITPKQVRYAAEQGVEQLRRFFE